MDSEALETLPVVRCPGCEEPMEPKGSAPVTRELDDVCTEQGHQTPRGRCDATNANKSVNAAGKTAQGIANCRA